ncbi:Protein argonaute 6 [Abeliophyllum distichum]|uniref:Protein argonaute 6 n=1 Tax=Abeliophyllum distichum TaxID=126358 RepID=A0ABD1QDE1_9LAMI
MGENVGTHKWHDKGNGQIIPNSLKTFDYPLPRLRPEIKWPGNTIGALQQKSAPKYSFSRPGNRAEQGRDREKSQKCECVEDFIPILHKVTYSTRKMDKAGKEKDKSPSLPPLSPNIPPNVKVEQVDLPKRSIICRPGFGTSGQHISLLTNHFKASIKNPDEIFYHYSVSIHYEDGRAVDSKGIGRKVIDKLYQTYYSELAGKRFAYDGANSLYTVGPLPKDCLEFTVLLEESIGKRGCPSHNGSLSESGKRGCLLVRQSFFHDDLRMFTDVGGGVTGVRGFHSSFSPNLGGLSLNMDVSTTVILTPGPVLDFLLANQNVREHCYIDWTKAKKTLKNMRIKARHNNMEFKIRGFSENPCHKQFFMLKLKNGSRCDGGGETSEITVYEYFTKHRSIELAHSAFMPCLDVGKPKRPSYLPLELCSLVPLQRYTKALSSMQKASLIVKSRQKPVDRIQVITDAVRNYCYDDNPLLTACGISIEKQLTQVDGRVLEAPKLKVGGSEDCFPCNGRWNFNNKKLFRATRIDSWALVNFSASCDISYISRELINCGRNKGIHIERPHTLIEEDSQSRIAGPVIRVERMFEQLMTKLPDPPEFLLCVLPERKNSDIYGPWKKKCLSSLGIVTQCISPVKINDQYLTNVLLKINSKLGGINSLLAIEHSRRIPLIKDTPTMILGMDVSHGSPGRSDIPSIAAVVGSRSWPLISRYRAAVRTQSSKVEMIESLFKPLANGEDDGIMRELLLDFYQISNGRKPSQIVVFRDGVNESQFAQVMNIELDQMIKAYQHLGEVDVPKFTLIVVQKNHHTKLFQAGAPGNVPPGTVVDTKVVHPTKYDFFMCSHAGMIVSYYSPSPTYIVCSGCLP